MTLQSLVLALVIAGPVPPLAARQDGASPPATRPATQPGTRPAVPASEPPEVTALLDRVARAYAALATLRLEGVVTGTFDAAGKQSRQELAFTSAMGEG